MSEPTLNSPSIPGAGFPVFIQGGIDIATADSRYLRKNILQVAVTDSLRLGAVPTAGGGVSIDATNFGNTGMLVNNSGGGGAAVFRIANDGAQVYVGTNGAHQMYFRTNSLDRWAIGVAGGVSSLAATQATARLISGSLNGMSVRNSADARDNFLVDDAGATATLRSATKTLVMGTSTLSGEFRSGAYANAGIAGDWINIFGSSSFTGTSGGATICYANGVQPYAALEVASVAAGFSTLDLMKAGGDVRIGRNAAYGAGVASLRLDGLTNGAGAAAGTLANAPAAGNPTFWIPVNIAGVVKYIPAW